MVSVSGKDRAAIFLAGKEPDARRLLVRQDDRRLRDLGRLRRAERTRRRGRVGRRARFNLQKAGGMLPARFGLLWKKWSAPPTSVGQAPPDPGPSVDHPALPGPGERPRMGQGHLEVRLVVALRPVGLLRRDLPEPARRRADGRPRPRPPRGREARAGTTRRAGPPRDRLFGARPGLARLRKRVGRGARRPPPPRRPDRARSRRARPGVSERDRPRRVLRRPRLHGDPRGRPDPRPELGGRAARHEPCVRRQRRRPAEPDARRRALSRPDRPPDPRHRGVEPLLPARRVPAEERWRGRAGRRAARSRRPTSTASCRRSWRSRTAPT